MKLNSYYSVLPVQGALSTHPSVQFLYAFKKLEWIKVSWFCWLLISSRTMALESDSQQPIYIDSNTATYNDKAQTSVYTGNVVTVQGSLRVNSDKLVVYLKNGDIAKLVATGNPAKFEQLPAKGKEKIKGEALIGEFFPDKSLLILKKDAVVWQGNNKAASELIRYDSKNALIKAGEKTSDAKRVHSVFKPKKKQEQAQ